MNKKQTVVMWVGVAFFLLCAWNPKWGQLPDFREHSYRYNNQHVFDDGLTALIARLSSTVIVTGLAVYTLRDKKPKDKSQVSSVWSKAERSYTRNDWRHWDLFKM